MYFGNFSELLVASSSHQSGKGGDVIHYLLLGGKNTVKSKTK